MAARLARARWVARDILPHDPQMRHWFLKRGISHDDIDEAMQEAYCRIALLETVEQIANPGAYLFSIARNLVARRLRKRPVVSLDTMAEMDACGDAPGLNEEQISNRLRGAKVRAMIAALPERCRRVVELRKIENWSQKEIAAHLGMTEKAVEKQVWLGVRAIREQWARAEQSSEAQLAALERRSGSLG